MEKIKRIIDQRSKAKFIVDDEYLNGYAKLCGWKATLVYFSLCRHVNRNQYCFPSVKLMAAEHSVSRDAVMDGIKILVQWNIIEVSKNKGKNGWKNNSYTLLDKSVWKSKPHQVADSDPVRRVSEDDTVSGQEQLDQVASIDTKETNSEGDTFKETHISNASVAGGQVNEFMDIFSKINPTLNWANKTFRASAAELIKKYGFETAFNMAKQVISIQGKPYAPVAINPYEMKEKLAKFKFYFDRQKNNQVAKKPKISIIS